MAVVILVSSILLLSLGYIFYGRFVARKLSIDPQRATPAHTMYDGIDYVPAKAPVLFGHHFASIAGAAPIVGPVVAAVYGWLPVVLWIIFGGIFLGAVHDFSALIASIRYNGRSIGEVIGVNVSDLVRKLFLIFLWATLVLLIAVYMVIVGKTFVAQPEVGTSSSMFIILAVVFGLTVYRWNAPLWLATLVGIVFLALCMFAGWYYPIALPSGVWSGAIIVYIFVASVAPVWILLQPRDYLNSFLLFALVIITVVGVFVANPEIKMPAFAAWSDPQLGPLFPILFVTVACGAISGYHSVVASGTSAKQLDNERDAKKISFGGMLLESLVAILATIMAVIFLKDDYVSMLKNVGPVNLFAQGAGRVISALGFPADQGVNFATLAVSAFVLTTLDTATRLARFAFQEFFAPKPGERSSFLHRNRYVATAVTVAVAAALGLSEKWPAIWPIFGTANQLLAALALLAVSLWLSGMGVRSKITSVPMIIMFVITLSSLVVLIYHDWVKGNTGLVIVGLILFGVAAVVIVESGRKVFERKRASAA